MKAHLGDGERDALLATNAGGHDALLKLIRAKVEYGW